MEEEAAAEAEEEEEGGGIPLGLNILTVVMAGTEEKAAKGLAEALLMEVVEDKGSEGKEGGGETLRALMALEFPTKEA